MSSTFFVWLDEDAKPWGRGETASQALAHAILAFLIAHQDDPHPPKISLSAFRNRGALVAVAANNPPLVHQWLGLDQVRDNELIDDDIAKSIQRMGARMDRDSDADGLSDADEVNTDSNNPSISPDAE